MSEIEGGDRRRRRRLQPRACGMRTERRRRKRTERRKKNGGRGSVQVQDQRRGAARDKKRGGEVCLCVLCSGGGEKWLLCSGAKGRAASALPSLIGRNYSTTELSPFPDQWKRAGETCQFSVREGCLSVPASPPENLRVLVEEDSKGEPLKPGNLRLRSFPPLVTFFVRPRKRWRNNIKSCDLSLLSRVFKL